MFNFIKSHLSIQEPEHPMYCSNCSYWTCFQLNLHQTFKCVRIIFSSVLYKGSEIDNDFTCSPQISVNSFFTSCWQGLHSYIQNVHLSCSIIHVFIKSYLHWWCCKLNRCKMLSEESVVCNFPTVPDSSHPSKSSRTALTHANKRTPVEKSILH